MSEQSAGSLSMRSDLLRFVYTGMLLETPFEDVRDYWLSHPFEQGDVQHSNEDVLRIIWREDQNLSLSFYTRALNDLEPFLNKRNISAVEFIKKTAAHLQGMVISPRSILLWSKSFLKHVHVTRDTRALMLQAAEEYTWNLAPGIVHRCLQTHAANGLKQSTMLLMLSDPSEEIPRNKRALSAPLPPLDYELWTVLIVESMPLCSELPRFEQYAIAADCRPIDTILPGRIEMRETEARLDGAPIARATGLHDHLREHGVDPSQYDLPDITVMRATKNHECPVRGRTVIHDGCVYGSPVFLYTLMYKPDLNAAYTPLSQIIEGALGKTGAIMFRLRHLHEKLIDSITARARIVYHDEDESISINGEYLIKYVPAKIFRRMIQHYLAEGRQQFHYKEFVHDPDIVVDANKPNLTVRIERLAQALENRFPHIKVERPKPGVVELIPRCKIEFCQQQ